MFRKCWSHLCMDGSRDKLYTCHAVISYQRCSMMPYNIWIRLLLLLWITRTTPILNDRSIFYGSRLLYLDCFFDTLGLWSCLFFLGFLAVDVEALSAPGQLALWRLSPTLVSFYSSEIDIYMYMTINKMS